LQSIAARILEEKRKKLLSLISQFELAHKEAILGYLKSAHVRSQYWGVMHDWLQIDTPRIGPGPRIFTDGVWAWSEEIIYYVKSYNLQLPEEFVDRMEALHWMVPPIEPFTLRERIVAKKKTLRKTRRPRKTDGNGAFGSVRSKG
jgi:hypothetical protein